MLRIEVYTREIWSEALRMYVPEIAQLVPPEIGRQVIAVEQYDPTDRPLDPSLILVAYVDVSSEIEAALGAQEAQGVIFYGN